MDDILGVPWGASTADIIKDRLAGYLGGSAIASELIQNADDAGATQVEFVFSEAGLTVRNDSYFERRDFLNILKIASGGNSDEIEKTGAWGTGFLSVFNLTDRPELKSNGLHLTFDPLRDVPKWFIRQII